MELSSTIFLEKTGLAVVLGVALVIYAIMTVIYTYHWKRFGIPTGHFVKMTRLYFWLSGSLALLSVLLYVGILVSF